MRGRKEGSSEGGRKKKENLVKVRKKNDYKEGRGGDERR